ncbi:MAG: response regulator transcription factor, partial [Pseudomonadota bacterium]
MKIKVLLVDDHKLFRNGLKQILEDTPDIVVVNEAPNVRTALKIVDDCNCDCDVIILDINLQDLNGLELIKRLKVRKFNYKILVLSMYPEDEYALRAI